MKKVIFIILLIVFILPLTTHAFSISSFSLTRAFGGTIAPFPMSFPCTCSPTGVYYLTIGPPSKLTLTYQAGTQKYLNKNLPYAINVLGFYDPSEKNICKIYVGTSCSVVPSAGNITSKVGSSKSF